MTSTASPPTRAPPTRSPVRSRALPPGRSRTLWASSSRGTAVAWRCRRSWVRCSRPPWRWPPVSCATSSCTGPSPKARDNRADGVAPSTSSTPRHRPEPVDPALRRRLGRQPGRAPRPTALPRVRHHAGAARRDPGERPPQRRPQPAGGLPGPPHPRRVPGGPHDQHAVVPLRLRRADGRLDGVRGVDARARPQHPGHRVRIEAAGSALRGRPSGTSGRTSTTMAATDAAAHLWSRTDLTPGDVDVAELYDGFSIITLMWLEALGFCGRGEGGPFVEGGSRIALDGDVPLNTNGGQLSAGRTHGFGLLHEACVQLRSGGGVRQVAGAEVALVATGGGPLASCLILTPGPVNGRLLSSTSTLTRERLTRGRRRERDQRGGQPGGGVRTDRRRRARPRVHRLPGAPAVLRGGGGTRPRPRRVPPIARRDRPRPRGRGPVDVAARPRRRVPPQRARVPRGDAGLVPGPGRAVQREPPLRRRRAPLTAGRRRRPRGRPPSIVRSGARRHARRRATGAGPDRRRRRQRHGAAARAPSPTRRRWRSGARSS